jgi:hypothetical protein
MSVHPTNVAAIGAWLVAGGALLGAAVSLYNNVTPLTGIDGTPGALLVIGSTAILIILGILLRPAGRFGRGLRSFLVGSSLLDIAGTALAAYLLESRTLLLLMLVCFAGWLANLTGPRGTSR